LIACYTNVTGASYDELARDRQKNLGINPDFYGRKCPMADQGLIERRFDWIASVQRAIREEEEPWNKIQTSRA